TVSYARIRPFMPATLILMTGSERYCTTVHEIEVAQPLELVIIGNAGCVTAESDLGANIQVEFRTTLCRLALERLALSPLINQERPFCLDPDRMRLLDRRRIGWLQTRQNDKE